MFFFLWYSGNFPICDGQGMDCVNNVTDLDYLADCIPSCKEVSYKIASTSAKIDEDVQTNLRIFNFWNLTDYADL